MDELIAGVPDEVPVAAPEVFASEPDDVAVAAPDVSVIEVPDAVLPLAVLELLCLVEPTVVEEPDVERLADWLEFPEAEAEPDEVTELVEVHAAVAVAITDSNVTRSNCTAILRTLIVESIRRPERFPYGCWTGRSAKRRSVTFERAPTS